MKTALTDTTRVLFVCVHNAARSRLAEALLRQLGGPHFEVASAGYEPRGANPLVIEALGAIGLKVQAPGPQPSVFELFKAGRHFHYVIGVCDEEHGQRCPLFPGVTQRISWSFPDPSTFTGSHEEKLARIAELRDAIRERIAAWLETLPAHPTDARQQAQPEN